MRPAPAPVAKLLRPALLLLALAVLPAAPAGARPPSPAETKSLGDVVRRFDTAMRANDFAGVSQAIPPRILEFIAAKTKISTEQLRALMMQQMAQTLKDVTIVSFRMDLDKAVPKALPDGSPYMLIPTETVIDPGSGGETTAVRSHTLALLDVGAWYLVRISDQAQVAILKQVYPGFAGETFPGSTTEAVKP